MRTVYEDKLLERGRSAARERIRQIDEEIIVEHERLDHHRYRCATAEAKRAALAAELRRLYDRNDGDRFQDVSGRHAEAVTAAGLSWAPVSETQRRIERLEAERRALMEATAC